MVANWGALLLVLVILGLALFFVIEARRIGDRARQQRSDASWPADLKRLVMSEQPLGIDHPLPLCGTPDEVYFNRDHRLVAVETKTRDYARVYLSDRIQLSVYAVLLRYARHRMLPLGPGRAVAGYGYVRIVTPHGVKWRAVELLTLAQVRGLVRRQLSLEQGREAPRGARHAGLCRSCVYRLICPKRRD